jgi:DNA-binding response OmpR family regulator
MNAKILLVEDHRPLAETVGLFLENTGFTLDYAADGLTALHLERSTLMTQSFWM